MLALQIETQKIMSMKQCLIKRIKKAGENIESTITNVVLVLIAGSYLTVLAFSKRAVNFSLQILTIPTPLWVSIVVVVLCCGYIYLKVKKIHSLQDLQNTTYIEKISELEKQIEIQNLDLMANIIEKNLSQDNTIGTLNERIKALENPDQYSHKVDALNKELKKIINHTNKT